MIHGLSRRALCEPACACDRCAQPFPAAARALTSVATPTLTAADARRARLAARRELVAAALVRAIEGAHLVGRLLGDSVVAQPRAEQSLDDLLAALPTFDQYLERVRDSSVSAELADPLVCREDLCTAIANVVIKAARARVSDWCAAREAAL